MNVQPKTCRIWQLLRGIGLSFKVYTVRTASVNGPYFNGTSVTRPEIGQAIMMCKQSRRTEGPTAPPKLATKPSWATNNGAVVRVCYEERHSVRVCSRGGSCRGMTLSFFNGALGTPWTRSHAMILSGSPCEPTRANGHASRVKLTGAMFTVANCGRLLVGRANDSRTLLVGHDVEEDVSL